MPLGCKDSLPCLRRACLFGLLATVVAGQDIGRAYAALREQLGTDPQLARQDRRELLQAFLGRFADTQHREVLEARLLLGSLQLQDMAGSEARSQFALVASRAALQPEDVRARALYGLHQAQRLEGDCEAARATLRELMRAFPGTVFARSARTAMAQLDQGSSPGVGDALPPLQFGRDVHGRTVATALPPEPRLLVFWSLEHEPSVRRLESLALAWQKAGMPAHSIVAFALEDDAALLRRFAARRQWHFTVLPADQGFLQPDWLVLGVHAVPTVLLIGRDNTVLARDVSADRLQSLLGSDD